LKVIHKNKKIIFIDSPGYGGAEINAIKLIKVLKNEYKIELVLNKNHCKQISLFAKENNFPVHLYNVENNKKI
jgi:fructose/tagatose bisphosphate aldolase